MSNYIKMLRIINININEEMSSQDISLNEIDSPIFANCSRYYIGKFFSKYKQIVQKFFHEVNVKRQFAVFNYFVFWE